MAQFQYSGSRHGRWTPPRPRLDPCERLRTYGRVRPMEQDRGLLDWLLRR